MSVWAWLGFYNLLTWWNLWSQRSNYYNNLASYYRTKSIGTLTFTGKLRRGVISQHPKPILHWVAAQNSKHAIPKLLWRVIHRMFSDIPLQPSHTRLNHTASETEDSRDHQDFNLTGCSWSWGTWHCQNQIWEGCRERSRSSQIDTWGRGWFNLQVNCMERGRRTLGWSTEYRCSQERRCRSDWKFVFRCYW